MFDAYGVLTEAWDGENIHLGIFERPDEPFAAAAERATARLAEAAGLRPGEEVLETACGIGGSARYLARVYKVHVTATNISEGQLALGRERTQAEGLADRVSFEAADFQALPFADAAFDAYWCQEAWLYAADKRAVVSEAYRVLRPTGRLVVSDFTLARPIDAAFEAELLDAVAAPGFWSREAYDRALREAGFSVVASEDWSEHAVPSWERVVSAFAERRETFEERLPRDAVASTGRRFELWLEAFRRGCLGWTSFGAHRGV